jgi:adenylate cyclase class 2
MYEVELKVRADHEAVRDRLEALGAERVGTVRQVDTYYDAPHRDFVATDEALRIRRERRDGETLVRLTYKGPLVEADSKTREEAETVVGDGATLADILQAVGFEPAATVEKERTRYRHEGYTIGLDEVGDLGTFVEVDRAVDAAMDVEAIREGAAAILADLGLDPDAQIRTSYLALLEEDSLE